MMKHINTTGIVSSLLITIEGVSINKSKKLHKIEVFCEPTGKPEYAQCKQLGMTVIGFSMWEECFGKNQKKSIIRICKKAVDEYFEN